MRLDSPATVHWLDSTALKCADEFHLSRTQLFLLRTLLAKAIGDFPAEALRCEFVTLLTTRPPVVLEEVMSPPGYKLWQKALILYQNLKTLSIQAYTSPENPLVRAWRNTGKDWFEAESHTTLNQPVRLVRRIGHPRDMVVTGVEIEVNEGAPQGRAVLLSRVFRPRRTYTFIQE